MTIYLRLAALCRRRRPGTWPTGRTRWSASPARVVPPERWDAATPTHLENKKKTCVQVYETVGVLATGILNTFELSLNTAFFCQICSISSI